MQGGVAAEFRFIRATWITADRDGWTVRAANRLRLTPLTCCIRDSADWCRYRTDSESATVYHPGRASTAGAPAARVIYHGLQRCRGLAALNPGSVVEPYPGCRMHTHIGVLDPLQSPDRLSRSPNGLARVPGNAGGRIHFALPHFRPRQSARRRYPRATEQSDQPVAIDRQSVALKPVTSLTHRSCQYLHPRFLRNSLIPNRSR